MRIVAGSAKGVRLAPVPRGVRPVSDRAREGVFSSLGPDRIVGARVLDLFAGTGAMGIEALSRGAGHATFIERSVQAAKTIHQNLALTRLGQGADVVAAEASSWLRTQAPEMPFDLVCCDPPYELGSPDLDHVLRELSAGWVDQAVFTLVLTRGSRSSTPVIPVHWAVARQLRYGDSLVYLIRPGNGESHWA
jgi:16S rRNA (guanine966-N2)-methyltransferase